MSYKRKRPLSLDFQSLLGRVIDDHQLLESGALPCKAKDHVVILDSDPPGRRGDFLCSLHGRSGYVPRSKLLLLGFIQQHGEYTSAALEESPIYEVPPGAMPKDIDDRLTREYQLQSIPAYPKTLLSSDANDINSHSLESEYVVFVDESTRNYKTSTPTVNRSEGRTGRNHQSPNIHKSTERQLVVKEGSGGHPSPILRHKSSLRSAQKARRHSSASVPEKLRFSGSSNSNNHRHVLRWADSPKIIEIPNSNCEEEETSHPLSEGEYDDLNVVTGDDIWSVDNNPTICQPQPMQPSRHSKDIRALLRNFNGESLRNCDVHSAKDLLEKIHWYMEDCSNRLLRFICHKWKTTETLAVTIPSLYDACTLYHSMSQVFTTFVYVCLDKSGLCDDKFLAKKLLKHLHPLEKYRQAYGNALSCLDSLQWQPAEIERLSETPVTDYLGDLVGNLREINIEERSLYTALIQSIDILFKDEISDQVLNDATVAFNKLTMVPNQSVNESTNSKTILQNYEFSDISNKDDVVYPSGARMPQPKPPMVPASNSILHAKPFHLVETGSLDKLMGTNHSAMYFLPSKIATFRDDETSSLRCDASGENSTVSSFLSSFKQRTNDTGSASPIPKMATFNNPFNTGRRHSNQFYRESSNIDEQMRMYATPLSQTSSTPPIYSPPSSLSPRGSGEFISGLFYHSNYQELQIKVAKMESHAEIVLTAIENFRRCLDLSQPPNVFVQHSKFIVVSAQKLLTVSNNVGHDMASSSSGQRVLVLTDKLCELLKSLVAVTKEAAIRFPSQNAMQDLLSRVDDVSEVAGRLKTEVTHLLKI